MTIRKKYWFHVGLCVLLIYSTLGIVRPICNFLKKVTPFNDVTNIFTLLAVIVILIVFKKYFHFKMLSSHVLFLICAGCFLYAAIIVKYPEEKVHLLEYGFLGFLLVRAIYFDWPDWRAFAGAVVTGFLLGWIDEGIQEILPGRYYDWNDVVFNGVATCLGVFLTFVIKRDTAISRSSR